jgi:hypothetical protein
MHYHREKNRSVEPEEQPTLPRIHRSASCRVEQPMLEKVMRNVKAMRQRAEERHWEFNQPYYDEHAAQAEQLLAKGEVGGAFRESCLAMMPLSAALHKQRNKEEMFQPLWDKAR